MPTVFLGTLYSPNVHPIGALGTGIRGLRRNVRELVEKIFSRLPLLHVVPVSQQQKSRFFFSLQGGDQTKGIFMLISNMESGILYIIYFATYNQMYVNKGVGVQRSEGYKAPRNTVNWLDPGMFGTGGV